MEMDTDFLNEITLFCRNMNIPFKKKISNFTVKFDSEAFSYYLIGRARSFKTFHAYKKIIGDVNGMPIHIDNDKLKYYNSEIHENIPSKFDKIYQIDLNSAYANILKNHLLISEKTFDYISKLNKDERLACVGMMASQKRVFVFDGYSMYYIGKEASYFSDYFYYCVQETYKIMEECKKIADEDFLFTWVDAIYLKSINKINPVINYIKSLNLKCKINILHNFEIKVLDEDFSRCLYYKNDDNKQSSFFVPLKEKNLNNYINKFVNENFISKTPEKQGKRI